MRLLKLTANKSTFHPVVFNEKGLSIIVGRRAGVSKRDDKKTYNGVGKSLIIQLIHFCLASNYIEEFEDKLSGWEFTLEFKLDNKVYRSSRNTSEQQVISLNGEKHGLGSFRDFLGERVFLLDEPVNYLKFRPLISRFIRPKKASYLSFCDFVRKEEDYAQLVCNSYLLGLDVNKVLEKILLKKELDETKKLKSNIEKDEIFRSYFADKNGVDINIADLEEKTQHLGNRLRKYEIAEDYDNIRKEANRISLELREYKNQATAYTNAIKNINRSLEISPDIPKERLLSLYKEAKVDLADAVIKRMEKVEIFHKTLLDNREKRLAGEKIELEEQLKEIEDKIVDLGGKENKFLDYLNTHGALEEHMALSKQWADLTTKLDKLKTHKEVLQQYKNKTEGIKSKFANTNIEANKYLAQIKQVVEKNLNIFRSFSREFYENKPGGIDVVNNDGLNKLRFNISAKIQDDASDGINEVKIFCFDWALLKAKHNHRVNFIFHDSRILANMDPRQASITFKQAHKNSVENNFQYIISANEDDLNSIKSSFEPKEYQAVIEDNKILELTDQSDKAKLLGIEVDMDYEKETKRGHSF